MASDDEITLERVFSPPEEPAWASVPPSGRPRHLRPAARSLNPATDMAFDTSVVPSHAAWDHAWSAMTIRRHGYDALLDETSIRPLRPALAAAFGPVLHDLAEQHHLARNDFLTLANLPYNERAPSDQARRRDALRYQRSIDAAVMNVVHNALKAGLFDTVLATLAQPTPISPEAPVPYGSRRTTHLLPPPVGPKVPLFSKLPPQNVGMAVLQAAFGYHRNDRMTPEQMGQRLHAMADGALADAFWSGWAQQVQAFTDHMDSSTEYDLAHATGFHLATLTRRPELVEVSARVFRAMTATQDIGTHGAWRGFGAQVGATLKRHYPRFGDTQEALFGIAPTVFWMGVRSEVLYSSKMGRWINGHMLTPAQANPSGPEAQALCLEAWLNLDKKQILDLEAALPGLSREHLPSLAVNGATLRNDRADLSDLVDLGATSHARWAMTTFKRAGAPTEDPQELSRWVREDPVRTVEVMLALYARIEGEVLAKTFRDHQAPTAQALPRKGPRSRL